MRIFKRIIGSPCGNERKNSWLLIFGVYTHSTLFFCPSESPDASSVSCSPAVPENFKVGEIIRKD
jgi:hypothetical protein